MLTELFIKNDISDLVGQKVSGLSSGVTALVNGNCYTDNSSDTIYVKYLFTGEEEMKKDSAKRDSRNY